MRVDGRERRTIWTKDGHVHVIDQTRLPHAFETVELRDLRDAERAIADMVVRGAPLIGVTGAYGLALALREGASDAALAHAFERLHAARPTAVNLRWGLERVRAAVAGLAAADRADAAFSEAGAMAEEDVAVCEAIGGHGLSAIRAAAARSGRDRVDVLTHCNAGWLATVDWGTALAPIYAAHRAGRAGPRLGGRNAAAQPGRQPDRLGTREGGRAAHRSIVDNTGGHLMQHGRNRSLSLSALTGLPGRATCATRSAPT